MKYKVKDLRAMVKGLSARDFIDFTDDGHKVIVTLNKPRPKPRLVDWQKCKMLLDSGMHPDNIAECFGVSRQMIDGVIRLIEQHFGKPEVQLKDEIR